MPSKWKNGILGIKVEVEEAVVNSIRRSLFFFIDKMHINSVYGISYYLNLV